MEIIIKNMVCPRCIEAVSQIFKDLDVAIMDIQLGKVRIKDKITTDQKQALKKRLAEKGFELLDDKHSQLINAIKSIIIQEVHHKEEISPVNSSTILSEQLHYDYSYLSRLFSSIEGQTIERYMLAQKVEKVKELLIYDELSLSEIAFRVNYSSSAHLSAQFKKITGMTPSDFKKRHNQERKSLDKL